jgi:hypothetical protein
MVSRRPLARIAPLRRSPTGRSAGIVGYGVASSGVVRLPDHPNIAVVAVSDLFLSKRALASLPLREDVPFARRVGK